MSSIETPVALPGEGYSRDRIGRSRQRCRLTGELLETLLESDDVLLVGTGFLQLQQRFSLAISLNATRLTQASAPNGDVGKYREMQN
jgi:hypothetical protein